MKILFFAFFSAFLELLWPMANSISIKGELGPILPGFVTYGHFVVNLHANVSAFFIMLI